MVMVKQGKALYRNNAYERGLKAEGKKLSTERSVQWYIRSSSEKDYWTLLIFSWYTRKEIFNTTESQKMLKQAMLPSHTISSLESF